MAFLNPMPRLRPLPMVTGALLLTVLLAALPDNRWSPLAMPGGASVLAQASYPQRQHRTINDYGEILSPSEQQELQDLLEEFTASTGIEVVLVTVPSIAAYNTGDRSFEGFATNLFNRWGIGDAQRNDGVLVLFSQGDRAVRIELGRGYSRAYNIRMQTVIDEYMLPRFRSGEYFAGLDNGSRALMRQLTGPAPTALERLPRPSFDALKDMGTAGLAGVVGTVLLLRRRNYLRPKCSSCNVRMQPLDAALARTHLTAGQRVELDLGAVRHTVLQCPQCHQISKRQRQASADYSRCPNCQFTTLEIVQQTTVAAATYSASGEAIASRRCHHCNHADETTIYLPRLERDHYSPSGSSSSGGGSSGGGSSSGGGASGQW